MVVITMDPSVDYLHYTPFDEAIERNVKVQGVNFRIFPVDAIWLGDFGTKPEGNKKKWKFLFDERNEFLNISTTLKEFY